MQKYNKNNGRFLTTDPLWEKYPFWNPYQYCMNNPVSFVDGGGEVIEIVGTKAQQAVLRKIIKTLKQTETGKSIVAFAEKSKQTVKLGFGELHNTNNGEFHFLGEQKGSITSPKGITSATYMEGMITIDSKACKTNGESVLGIVVHELTHHNQAVVNPLKTLWQMGLIRLDPSVYWIKSTEIEAKKNEKQVDKEIPAAIHDEINEEVNKK